MNMIMNNIKKIVETLEEFKCGIELHVGNGEDNYATINVECNRQYNIFILIKSDDVDRISIQSAQFEYLNRNEMKYFEEDFEKAEKIVSVLNNLFKEIL